MSHYPEAQQHQQYQPVSRPPLTLQPQSFYWNHGDPHHFHHQHQQRHHQFQQAQQQAQTQQPVRPLHNHLQAPPPPSPLAPPLPSQTSQFPAHPHQPYQEYCRPCTDALLNSYAPSGSGILSTASSMPLGSGDAVRFGQRPMIGTPTDFQNSEYGTAADATTSRPVIAGERPGLVSAMLTIAGNMSSTAPRRPPPPLRLPVYNPLAPSSQAVQATHMQVPLQSPHVIPSLAASLGPGVAPGIASGLSPAFSPGRPGLASGLAPGLAPGIVSGISSGSPSRMAPGIPSGKSSGVFTGLPPGMAPGGIMCLPHGIVSGGATETAPSMVAETAHGFSSCHVPDLSPTDNASSVLAACLPTSGTSSLSSDPPLMSAGQPAHPRLRRKKRPRGELPSDFYRNGMPSEVIIIPDDSPPPPKRKIPIQPSLRGFPDRTTQGSLYVTSDGEYVQPASQQAQQVPTSYPLPTYTGPMTRRAKKALEQLVLQQQQQQQQQLQHRRRQQQEQVDDSFCFQNNGVGEFANYQLAPPQGGALEVHQSHVQHPSLLQKESRAQPQPTKRRKKVAVPVPEQPPPVQPQVPAPLPPAGAVHQSFGPAAPYRYQNQAVMKPVAHEPALPPGDDKDGHYIVVPNEYITPRYRIIKLLGQGTFGRVVQCWDEHTHSYVAIKIIRAVPKYREASQTEIRVLNRLRENDPANVKRCIHMRDCFDFQNHVCMTFDLLGESVFDFLKSNGFKPFPAHHIQHMAHQLMVSVAFVHDLGLIHTDLKPENILLLDARFKGKTKKILYHTDIQLIDFGSATFQDEYHPSVVSTRHYRAPEIILGSGWSYPCDMWSIGCILIELYTGSALFQTHDNLEHLAMMEAVLGKIPESVVQSVGRHGAKYFRYGQLNYPSEETSRGSRKAVRSMRPLQNLVAPTTSFCKRFLDLLLRLLRFDPSERINAREALCHEFFQIPVDQHGKDIPGDTAADLLR